MNVLNAIGEAVLASAAAVSIYAYVVDAVPSPFNALLLGSGAGAVGAMSFAFDSGRKRSKTLDSEGALPGVPAGGRKGPKHSRTKAQEKQRLLAAYDRAFSRVLSRHGLDARLESLERLKPILYELSPDLRAWTGEMRMRAYLLMNEIAPDLDDPTCVQASLGLLVLILSRGGRSAAEMAKPIFYEKIQAMYADPKHESERFLPRLLLMLDDYELTRVEMLTKEAIHSWADGRFAASRDYLGLEEIEARGTKKRLRDMLGGEIANAGVSGDRTALDRAVELYHAVK